MPVRIFQILSAKVDHVKSGEHQVIMVDFGTLSVNVKTQTK